MKLNYSIEGIRRRHAAWATAEWNAEICEHPDTECSGDRDRAALLALIEAEAAAPPATTPAIAGDEAEASDDYRDGYPDADDTLGLPKCHRCGNIAYQPDQPGPRKQARRCGGCHRTTGNCNCPPFALAPQEPDHE